MWRVLLSFVVLLSSAIGARSDDRSCPATLDQQFASPFVQRGLIASGFLDAEVGHAMRTEMETAIRRFHGDEAKGGPVAPLSEADCVKLGDNIDALMLTAGFTPVVFEKTKLKLLYPSGLSPGQEPNLHHTTAWYDLDTADYSFGIDIFKKALYSDTPLSLQSSSLTMLKNITLFYQQTTSDEATWEGVGDLTHHPTGEPPRTVRYYFHNLAYEYNGEVRGLYLKYAVAPPAWFKPVAHLVPATRSAGNVVSIEHDFGKLSEVDLAWIVFVRAINNIIVSQFSADNGWVELQTGKVTDDNACATVAKPADPAHKTVRVIFGTTRNITSEFQASSEGEVRTSGVASLASTAGPSMAISRLFGNADDGKLHIGCAQISTPDLASDSAPKLRGVRHLKTFDDKEQKYIRLVDNATTKPMKRALLFVHGYNTTFDAALLRAAELAAHTDYAGTVYMFSWPSHARAIDYFTDQDSAEGAQAALRAFMRAILQDRNVKKLDVVAHSMGALQVLRALEHLQATFDRRADNSAKPEERRLRLGQVVFAAPDVDSDNFRKWVTALAPWADRVTVYVSRGDIILWVSSLVRKGRMRAGTFAWGEKPIAILSPASYSRVQVIDVTGTRSGWGRIIPDRSFGHSDFVNNPVVNRDVGMVLQADYPKLEPTSQQEARGRNKQHLFCKRHYAGHQRLSYWVLRAPPPKGEDLPPCDTQ